MDSFPAGVAEESYLDLTKPISNWLKTTSNSTLSVDNEGDKTSHVQAKCCRSITECGTKTLKGFEYCHKHILEDKTSPFRRCSFISKSDYRRCRNPTPVVDDKRSYCMQHDKEGKRDISKNKGKKKRRPVSPHDKSDKKRPSTLPVSASANEKRMSSSDEDEFDFITDTVEVHKTECAWLGNQASDAESTDSEDENPLNHAGVWTLEECIQILKGKMIRLQHLYTMQYKRLNHGLREERRKMLKDYDMDAGTLSKVGFEGCPVESFEKFAEGVQLFNYQKLTGPELVAEKLWKERRVKEVSLRARKNDLPRCSFVIDGQRCQNKMLPSSKFCYNHVTQDGDQHLFCACSFKYENGTRCSEPATTFTSFCHLHPQLLREKPYEKSFNLFQNAKQRCENRKRKILEKERLRGEPRVKRSSARLKECSGDVTKKGDNIKDDEDKTLMEIKRDRERRTNEKNGGQNEIRSGNSSPRDGNIFDKVLFEGYNPD